MITNIIFLILTLYSIISGVRFGYNDSHTPPQPFLISIILVILGWILISLKEFLFRNRINYKIHLAFIMTNILIVLYCLLIPFI